VRRIQEVTKKILDFKVELRESAGGDVYATASIDNANANAHQKHPSGDLGSLAGWTKQADIESKIDGDTAGADIKQFYKSRWGDIDNFLKIRQQWKNSNLIFSKQPMTKKSIAIKGLLGAQEVKSDPKSAIQCDFQRYNIWYLEGEVSDGLLTSEALP